MMMMMMMMMGFWLLLLLLFRVWQEPARSEGGNVEEREWGLGPARTRSFLLDSLGQVVCVYVCTDSIVRIL